MREEGDLESVDQQVSVIMQCSEFGDLQIKEMMTSELRQKLTEAQAEGRPLRVYCGYDVTAPDIHLGHMVILRKMRQFQDFGHEVTFLIGTFTTLIGDPSDRDEARKIALEEDIRKNAQTYADQALKILDPVKTKIRYNYEWLSKLTFADVISMASCFTVQQFLVRDRLRNRYDKNDPIWLRELLYPLAQGYDAVSLQADVQIGATEQLFNLMAGRKLQEVYGQKPQVCITYPVLVGTDGVQRMSKTTGNYIGVDEPPEQIYGKVMSIRDEAIIPYFELLTDVPESELRGMKKQLDSGVNPMMLKKRLARDIVNQLYGKKSADEAEEHFEKVVQKKEEPDEIEEYTLINDMFLSQLMTQAGLCSSRSEAVRLIKQGAVTINGQKVSGINHLVSRGATIKVGKRRYLKTT
ncbi:MAG TPA: tyrosine--tRNA ligase [Dehalococcoidia bacterium]|nr:tyrosine--tRNA ligase [Dehalococcoidia bacterium]